MLSKRKCIFLTEEMDKKCVMCGRSAGSIIRNIDGTTYVFDNEECVMTFRKFHSVYGKYFSMLLKDG